MGEIEGDCGFEIPRRALAFCGALRAPRLVVDLGRTSCWQKKSMQTEEYFSSEGLAHLPCHEFSPKWSTGASIPQQEPSFHIQTGTSFPQSLAVSL